ncbi:YicC/YloC family endoribonuclease [Desulforamulus ruminis]|uniref:YicC-like domain-containing protein n=1 Tax=Desulforamulus ruminis (strain ATCC 23193 / DSM 2154 / NCIMB 8452 / DL) TaxID=696281 RepID=F6DM98_DESRL|nr:YicC/YloC family endoribonuclease [Desulforamulus ruminis]AEG60565.1 YicC-like domain-containing protein [Desulforamulus ruminis DSM 2154]
MIKSMTGFGRGEACAEGRRFTVELKSVNNRYCEVILRQPRSLSQVEDKIKRQIQDRVARGRVDGYISIEETGEVTPAVKVDKALAVAYHKSMEELKESLSIPGDISLKDLISLPNVISLEQPEENVEQWFPAIEQACTEALTGLINMRQNEGARLKADILQHAAQIKELILEQVAERAPLVVQEHRAKLTQKLAEWLEEGALDENRLAAEVAIFTDRADISEEIVRLNSHVKQLEQILSEGGAVGRKLDFLVQEMNREINTIGSKANDLMITNAVVNAKSELEKIREQVQNIE